MDGELETFGLGVAAFLFEVVGVVDAQAASGGIIGVRLAEPGGLGAEGAVGEKFACAELKALIAEAGADAEFVEMFYG